MERRKFLIGAGSLAAGAAAATGTGAFTSVSANRTVSVNVTGDESALLGITANDAQSVGEYVGGTDGGQLTIDLDEDENGDAEGLNQDAVTTIGDPDDYETEYVFKIENQGTQPVFIQLSYDFTDASWADAGKDQSYLEFIGRGNELERVVGEYRHRHVGTFPMQRPDGTTVGGGPAGAPAGSVKSSRYTDGPGATSIRLSTWASPGTSLSSLIRPVRTHSRATTCPER
ncbi:hypothetical protein [Halosegnis marinus]|uniref:hypothetical protein n=1 Tax=Halosegnis marinus TaxID=3034023 RepID=UPI00360EE1E2